MLHNNNIILRLIFIFVGIKVEMKVSTTGYPSSFYENERINIECTATEYTGLLNIRIKNRGSDATDGCSYGAGEYSCVTGLLQPAFPRLTDQICESSLHYTTPPSTLSVPGTVTDDLIGLQLYCYADTLEESDENGNLTITTIRGKLI